MSEKNTDPTDQQRNERVARWVVLGARAIAAVMTIIVRVQEWLG